MAICIFSAGFLAAKTRISSLDVAVLTVKKQAVVVRGRVLNAEFNSRGNLSLILNDVTLLDRSKKIPRAEQKEEAFKARIKLSVLKYNQIPKAGNIIEVFAALSPPPMPSHPEGFHYGRHLWFKKIGATAIALSSPQIIDSSEDLYFLNKIRDSVYQKILKSGEMNEIRYESKAEYEKAELGEKNPTGLDEKRSRAIAAALITGKRGAIDKADYAAMRDAGLAHVLAISGLHMGLLCGAVFFMTRLILTHMGSFTLFHPVKKYAAATAIVGGGIYLLLSGMGVPALRAYIMVSVLFGGMIFSRRSISLRVIAIAAMIILIFTPESLLSVSFQMSFAAVTALVFFYEKFGARFFHNNTGNQGWFNKLSRYFLATIFTALIAEIAIAPIAIYHFNHLPLYGILANLLVMPIITFWIMPFLLITLILLPFGLEAISLVPMCYGIELMLDIAHYISNLPGSTAHFTSLKTLNFHLIIIGALWFLLWKEKWRYAGLICIAGAIIMNFGQVKPDILIDSKAKYFAITDENNNLFLSNLRLSKITQKEWSDLFNGTKLKRWPKEGNNWIKCDKLSCIYHKKGYVIALVKNEKALPEDCKNSDVLLSLVPIEIKCDDPQIVIDKWDIYHGGAYAIYLQAKSQKSKKSSKEHIKIVTTHEFIGRRPWSLYDRKED
jgi:competence protein ComEC